VSPLYTSQPYLAPNTGDSTAFDTGTGSGSTGNSTEVASGASSEANTAEGGGENTDEASNVMPSLVVIYWQRVA